VNDNTQASNQNKSNLHHFFVLDSKFEDQDLVCLINTVRIRNKILAHFAHNLAITRPRKHIISILGKDFPKINMLTTSFLASMCLAVAIFSTAHAIKSPYAAFAVPTDRSDRSDRSATRKPSTTWPAAVATASLAIVLTTAALALAANADIRNGATLFTANCAGCHAGGQNVVKENKTLQKAALEKYQSLDQAQLQKFVQTGMPHKFMPFKFSDEDYKDVTSYVLDQALGDKW
jgi:cytochrome c6